MSSFIFKAQKIIRECWMRYPFHHGSVFAFNEYCIVCFDKKEGLGFRALRWILHCFDAVACRHIPNSCNNVAIIHKKIFRFVHLDVEYSFEMNDLALLFKCNKIVDDDMTQFSTVSQNNDTICDNKNSRSHNPLLQIKKKTRQAVVPGAVGNFRHVKCLVFLATELQVNNGFRGQNGEINL